MARGASAEPGSSPLAEWKLVAPRSRPGVVRRKRLFAALDRHASARLTLLDAPAGFGKTELVASWLETHPDVSVAWVTLDRADADPLRFWTYVAQAADRVRPGMARPALARLRTPATPLEEVVDELMNAFSTFEGRLVIVIDDLHHFLEGGDPASFRYAVEHLPETARLVATTRLDPPLGLGRLRSSGGFAEIRAGELAFTASEARELLVDNAGISMDDEQLELLVGRTEGWPAGLSLAGLWLAQVEDPGAEVEEFSGDHRFVAEYLTEEVLDALDSETRSFLLRTSILERFCAPLCDAVLQRNDSQETIAALTRSNLFLVPLDRRGEWHRYHQLFRDLLGLELNQDAPDAVTGLHARAAAWFLEHELIDQALEHSAAAGDADGVAEVLAAEHLRLMRSGSSKTVLAWIEWLPDELLRDQPELAAAGAVNSVLLGLQSDVRTRLLRLVDPSRAKDEDSRRMVDTLLAVVRAAVVDSDMPEAIGNAREAVELANAQGDQAVTAALAGLGYVLYLQGDLAGADDAAREALSRPEARERPHGFVYASACASLVESEREHFRAAEASARRAVETARKLGLDGAWSAGLAHLALGRALLADGRASAAERELERAEMLRRGSEPRLDHVHALLVLAECRVARGRLSLATAELRAAREQLDAFSDAGRLPELADRVADALDEALAGAQHDVDPPTPSELAVLRLLATDLTQREIGRRLFLSLNTVKTHSRSLYRKLGASSREEAVRRASAAGLIQPAVHPGEPEIESPPARGSVRT